MTDLILELLKELNNKIKIDGEISYVTIDGQKPLDTLEIQFDPQYTEIVETLLEKYDLPKYKKKSDIPNEESDI